MKQDRPRPCPEPAAPAGPSDVRSRDDVVAESVRRLIEDQAEPPPQVEPPTRGAPPAPPPAPSPPAALMAPVAPLACGLSLPTARGETAPARRAARAVQRIAARFLRRPDAPRILAAALLLVVVIARPWFVVSLAVFALLLVLIVFLSLGPDRTSELIAARYDRLHRRDPERAERLRSRAGRLSAIASRLVARLPESWTTGLYLPDFEDAPAPPGMLGADPFDRLRAQGPARDPARNPAGDTPCEGGDGSGAPTVRPRRMPPSAGRCTPGDGHPRRCRPG